MRLVRHCLRVRDSSNLNAFYSKCLGMQAFGSTNNPIFGYDTNQCCIEFDCQATAPYKAAADDLYWKMGLTLRNLDGAVAYLRRVGCEVSDPHQFEDIGYMSHIRDPEGFVIELLQHGFKGNAKPAGEGHPIGSQATLAHITLRVRDMVAAKAFCEHQLGMRLMSIQPVQNRGFTLYFYTWSQERLPCPDLEAVENREWLWSRPYALLELQHLENRNTPLGKPKAYDAGFAGFGCRLHKDGEITYVSIEAMESGQNVFANGSP